MHIAIDTLTAIILLFFFIRGYKRGLIISFLSVIRIVAALFIALLIGKYLGAWFCDTFNKPRLVTLSVFSIVAFAVILFIFRVLIVEILFHRGEKEDSHLNLLSRLSGATISAGASALVMTFIFWLIELGLVLAPKMNAPNVEKSFSLRFSNRAMYEISYRLTAREGNEDRAATIASTVSNPKEGLVTVEAIVEADSVQGLLSSAEFKNDFLSGEAYRIRNNDAMRSLLADRKTIENLRKLGVISEVDTKTICEKLARMGGNIQAKLSDEKMQICIQHMKDNDLLNPKNIGKLIRDGHFHYFLDNLLK